MRAARERWQDRLTADPWLTAWYAFMAAMLITGAAYIAAGIAQGSTKTAGDGGDWVFFAAFLAGPFWLARLHRLGYTVAEWRVLGSSVLELS